MIVKQRDVKDCGICCVQYLIKYYGGYVSLERLRLDAYVTKEGTTAYHLLETLKKYQFQAYGIRAEESTLNTIPLPAIVHFQYENGLKHFVILLKVKKNKVYLMDPAKGNDTMDKNTFLNLWTKVLLIAYPQSQIPKLPKEKGILSCITSLLKKEKNWLVLLIFSSILLTGISILGSFYTKVGLELPGNQNTTYLFLQITFIFLVLVGIKRSLESFKEKIKNKLNRNMESKFIYAFLSHLFSLPIPSFVSHTKGELLTRVKETENIQNSLLELFLTGILDGSLGFISFLMICFINISFAYISLFGLILYLLVNIKTAKYLYKLIFHLMGEEELWNTSLTENLDLFLTMKHLNQTPFIVHKLEYTLCKYYQNQYQYSEKLRRISALKQTILELLIFASNAFAIYLIQESKLSIYNFIFLQTLFLNVLEPLKKITDYLPSLYYLKGLFTKISDFQSIEEEQLENPKEFHNGKIIFQQVSYSYTGYQNQLNAVSFEINPQKLTLLDGPSGCGKSTVCKLINRQFTNYQGTITIHGQNLLDYSLATIRANVTYLSQNETLMNGTIKENIVFGRFIADQTFQDICQICHLEEIVSKKAFRYNEYLMVNECNLSGGEIQRIILARALLNNTPIYILDECLSEVSELLEREILKNIKSYFSNQTIIYISHKPIHSVFDEVITLE